jgi:hypothetical protein
MRRWTTRCFETITVTLLSLGTLVSPARAAANYDYDPSADFSKYKTFRWIGDGPGAASRAQRNRTGAQHPQLSPLVEKQIGESVKSTLEAKGLTYVDQGPTTDLGVAIHTGSQREVVGYGWGPRHLGPRRVEVNKEGVLTIDLVDRQARELIWRGWIAAPIKEDPEKLHKQIESLVEKVLYHYPPPAK